MFEHILSELKNIPDLRILENEPMSHHTTFKIGGPARLFLDAHSTDALSSAYSLLCDSGVSPLILGNGSNLLVSDSGFDGTVLKVSCNKITICENRIFAEAGALLSSVASLAQKSALSGLEFAHGIPGSVGGAVVMNAGAYGGEISDVLICSTYISKDGIFRICNKEHNFGYRNSIYKHNSDFTVLSAEFELSCGDAEKIAETMRELAEKRRSKQPLEYPSAGSVFKRPEGCFAGALIEQCGLKGFSIGGAEVSEKHAGFIVNRGGATACDVRSLIEHIQNVVLKETGISLECEICFVQKEG